MCILQCMYVLVCLLVEKVGVNCGFMYFVTEQNDLFWFETQVKGRVKGLGLGHCPNSFVINNR